jgi:dTDP-4-amino-4,6-dideoxygalactose transaminase
MSDLNLDPDAALNRFDRDVLAVVPVHMYGNIADTRTLEQAADSAGIGLIDNAAHIAGAKGEDGYVPGTRGAFGLVSFAQSKSIVCGNSGSGGVLAINRDEYIVDARKRCSLLPLGDTRLDLEFALLGRHIKPAERLWLLRKMFARRQPTPLESHITSISPVHAAIAAEQIRSLKSRIDDKKRVVELYARRLREVRWPVFPQYAPGRYLTRVMARFPSLKECNRAKHRLAQSGIATRRGYPPVARAGAEGQSVQEHPLLELPSGYGLCGDDVEFIGSRLLTVVA